MQQDLQTKLEQSLRQQASRIIEKEQQLSQEASSFSEVAEGLKQLKEKLKKKEREQQAKERELREKEKELQKDWPPIGPADAQKSLPPYVGPGSHFPLAPSSFSRLALPDDSDSEAETEPPQSNPGGTSPKQPIQVAPQSFPQPRQSAQPVQQQVQRVQEKLSREEQQYQQYQQLQRLLQLTR